MPIAYKKRAIIDDYQRRVLETWLEPLCDDVITVSRGHSLPIEQLQTIAVFAADNGIVFPEFNPTDVHERAKITYDGKELEAYAWWQTWVECLRRGIVVNPPLAAVVPFAFGTHKAGDVIQASPHIVLLTEDPHVRPCPFDLSGRINRGLTLERVDLSHVADIARQAKLNGAPIRNVKVEAKNNCVHVDLEKQSIREDVMESNFMSLSKNDFVKSVGPAVFGAIIPLVAPVYNGVLASLLAGQLPALPTLDAVSTLLLKCVGISLSASVGYIAHKFFSNEKGEPFNGMLSKYVRKSSIDAGVE